MAIKKCLYCHNEISEFADPCPKCTAKHPLDDSLKAITETIERNKRKIKAALNSSIGCAECGSPINVQTLLNCSGLVCAHCGFSKNFLKCHVCGGPADSYDPVEDEYICKEHPRCYICGKKFKIEKLIIRRSGKYHFFLCCRSCANPVEYLFKKIWQKIMPGISKNGRYLRRSYPEPPAPQTVPMPMETGEDRPDQAHAEPATALPEGLDALRKAGSEWASTHPRELKPRSLAVKNLTPHAHCAVAKTLLYQRRYEEATANAETAIARDPNYADGCYLMGVIQTFAGKSAEAVDYFLRAIKLDPGNTGSYSYHLGLAQYCLKKYDEAVTSLEKSIQLNPQYGPWPLAVSYAQLNRGQEAADILANYFDRRKWPVVFIENTFKAWPFKEPGDMDHWAEGLLKSGLIRPWNPVYRREYENATADAEEVIKRNPHDPKAHYTMGESLLLSGRSADAIDYLEKAISLDSDYPGHYLFILGLAQFCLERYQEAALSLEICLHQRKMHSNPPMWLLAAAYAYLGRQREAEDALTKYANENGFKDHTVDRVVNYYLPAFKEPKDIERFANGLQRSGMPRN